MAFKVIRGYRVEEKNGDTCIYTLEGEKIYVSDDDIERSFENEAGKKGESGLSTFFLKADATVKIEVSLADVGASASPHASTITKYIHDGGTISKSRDDTLLDVGGRTIYKYLDDGGTISKARDDT
jgi:hypothetical protein